MEKESSHNAKQNPKKVTTYSVMEYCTTYTNGEYHTNCVGGENFYNPTATCSLPSFIALPVSHKWILWYASHSIQLSSCHTYKQPFLILLSFYLDSLCSVQNYPFFFQVKYTTKNLVIRKQKFSIHCHREFIITSK